MYSQAGNATLLLKSSSNPYGDTVFSLISNSDYGGSTLQGAINTVESGFPARELAIINARATLDGISGTTPADQKLWPLSSDEYTAINDSTVRGFGVHFWLRSSPISGYAFAGLWSGYDTGFISRVSNVYAIRPAFQLNLSSVLFTSASVANTKSAATLGSGLASAAATTGPVKLTVRDDVNLSLTCTDTGTRTVKAGGTVSIAYSNAQTAGNKYVSCAIENSGGTVLFYGKLSQATSGSASFTVPALPDSNYTINLFNEECNGDETTDFTSTPVPIAMRLGAPKPASPLPKTGDSSPLYPLLAVMGAALAGMGWLGFRKRGGGYIR